MKKPSTAIALACIALVAATGPAGAADDSLGADLKATIALQGKPCDQISTATRNADSDYTATCKDGNRYHVFVNAQGRVVVEKL